LLALGRSRFHATELRPDEEQGQQQGQAGEDDDDKTDMFRQLDHRPEKSTGRDKRRHCRENGAPQRASSVESKNPGPALGRQTESVNPTMPPPASASPDSIQARLFASERF